MGAKRQPVVLAVSKYGVPVRFDNDLVVRKEVLLCGVPGHDRRPVGPAWN